MMNLPKNWELKIDSSVLKSIKKFSRNDRIKLDSVIKLLVIDPYFGDIKKMKGEEDVWRRRVGSYRILYKLIIKKSIVFVFRVERRNSKTY